MITSYQYTIYATEMANAQMASAEEEELGVTQGAAPDAEVGEVRAGGD